MQPKTFYEFAEVMAKGIVGVGAPIAAIQAEVDWVMHLILGFLAICVSAATFFSILLTIRRKQREEIDTANRMDRAQLMDAADRRHYREKRMAKRKQQRRASFS